MRIMNLALVLSFFGTLAFGQAPEVKTTKITEVSYNSMRVLGSTGGKGITERGFCYSLLPGLNAPENYIKFGTGSFGGYSSKIVGLIPDTTYYVRAYGICEKNYCYGEELEVKTTKMPQPEVLTLSYSEITKNSARIQGRVSGPENSECGVCISETEGQEKTGRIVKVGASNFGSYSIKVNKLKPNTTYYACFFATNPAGTAYGEVISFTTTD